MGSEIGSKNSSSSSTPWKNGYYQSKGTPSNLINVEGETMFFYPASGKPTNRPEATLFT